MTENRYQDEVQAYNDQITNRGLLKELGIIVGSATQQELDGLSNAGETEVSEWFAKKGLTSEGLQQLRGEQFQKELQTYLDDEATKAAALRRLASKFGHNPNPGFTAGLAGRDTSDIAGTGSYGARATQSIDAFVDQKKSTDA